MAGVDLIAREVVVHGRVQGVFFRTSCREAAERKGLTGWVTNEPDGSVRAWFEGAAGEVAAMVEWCQHGPPGAVVERVTTDDRRPSGLRRFEVR